MEKGKTGKYPVFVYGTLMRGGRNPMPEGSRFIQEAITKENSYFMRQFNSFSSAVKFSPGVIRNGNGFIEGEVWEVDDIGLKVLHELEGYNPEGNPQDNHYSYEEIELQDGSVAGIYIFNSGNTVSKDQSRINFDENTRIYSWNRTEPAP